MKAYNLFSAFISAIAFSCSSALAKDLSKQKVGDFGKEKTTIGDSNNRGIDGSEVKRPSKTPTTRILTFPTSHSVGTIYSYKPDDEHMLGNSPRIAEAQGKVEVPENLRIYMIPSDYAIEHPELMDNVEPNAFYGFSFGRKGAIMSVDKFVPHIARLTGLKRLHMKGCDLTDNQIAPLGALRNLEELILEGNNFNGSCLTNLSKLPKLTHLDLNFTPLKPPAFETLSHFPALEDLAVPKTGVDDAALLHLSKIKKLRWLCISDSHITAKGLAHLKASKTLKYLNVSGCTLRNQDVFVLKGMPLTSVILPWKPANGQELTAIRKAFPGTGIDFIDRTPSAEQIKTFAPLH